MPAKKRAVGRLRTQIDAITSLLLNPFVAGPYSAGRISPTLAMFFFMAAVMRGIVQASRMSPLDRA
jgi:hypothetical protein